MNEKHIRMIGLDLDGTVFNRKSEMTEHTKEVLEETIRRGVVVLPATGRPECGLPQIFLQMEGVQYALTSNGARILNVKTGEDIFLELIPWQTAVEFVSKVRNWPDCVWEIYCGGKIYVDEESYRFIVPDGMSPSLQEYIRRTRIPRKDICGLLEREKMGLEKIHMIFMDSEFRDEKMEELRKEFPQLDISNATSFNMEINSAKAGKGKALLALGKILGIEREEIMACGDASNDWDMLREVGFPVVMENADEETKKLAAFITRSNEEDGVAYAIERFVLNSGL